MMSDDFWGMFGKPRGWKSSLHGNPHARTGDPATSHEAVPSPRAMSAQMIRVLRGYRDGVARTDHDAYRMVGMDVDMNGARQRCTDLRHAGYIEWTGGRGETPSGKSGNLSRITTEGIEFLETLEGNPPDVT